MSLRLNLILLTVSVCLMANAATVDTVNVPSPSMNKNIPAIVIKPDQYQTNQKFPVVYLLHGYSGCYKDWVKQAPGIKNLSDQYQMILVCPDGSNSWYFDSPVNPSVRYETFVSGELVNWIDHHYKTIGNRENRAITGLSMGGHGALYLAIRHQDIFGAAGSMSGGVDFRPFPNNWDIHNQLGSYGEHPENWESHTVINLLHLLTPNSLRLIIDCGSEDFFYNVNKNLHEQLLYRNIPHDFTTRPGSHNWQYWNNSIKYHLLFFNDYFQSHR